MRLLCAGLALASAMAQPVEIAKVDRSGKGAVLIVDSPRPVDSAALLLAGQFGLLVSVEDPEYLFPGDIQDVTLQISRQLQPNHRIFVPKGGRLETPFSVRGDGSPADPRKLIQDLVERANSQFPFRYRLDTDGDSFAIVPTRTRDADGKSIAATALLDRRVTIPPGARTLIETAGLMASALSLQTGKRVSCCQASVAGVPWGLASVTFEATDEPARSVLKRLIVASLNGQPNHSYAWTVRCDPNPAGWCFVNLMSRTRTD